jgi:hypothetical protein
MAAVCTRLARKPAAAPPKKTSERRDVRDNKVQAARVANKTGGLVSSETNKQQARQMTTAKLYSFGT